MAAIRQEPGELVSAQFLALFYTCCGSRRSSCCRYSQDRGGASASPAENDDALWTPASAAERGCQIGKDHWRAALDIDLLQFVALSEAHPAAVGRPEGEAAAFGSGQWLRGGRIQAAHPKLGL